MNPIDGAAAVIPLQDGRSRLIKAAPIVSHSDAATQRHFLEFFAASIRNANTRHAYYRACHGFLSWVEAAGIRSLPEIEAVHVAAWVEWLSGLRSTATVKQHLAAVKMLLDFLVVRQVLKTNPAAAVRSPRHIVRKGKTPVLDPSEARQLIDAINISSVIGLRDRALIGTMIYSLARIGAALSMRVDDVYTQNRRLWIRLHEKGGKLHDMPCHHELEEWLDAYLHGARISHDKDGWLFRSMDRETKQLSHRRLQHANAYSMVKRRARAAGLKTEISNHTFRATGITAYLLNNGTLERAAKMANHASTRTTQLYDRRDDRVTLGEVEKVRI